MRVLYMAASGAADPNRASIPFHLAANGSAANGDDVGLVLAGDSTELLAENAAEKVEALGIPPLRELFTAVADRGLRVYVCKGCAVARGITEDDLKKLNGEWVTAPDVGRLISESDRVVTL